MEPFLVNVAASLTAALLSQAARSSVGAFRSLVGAEPMRQALRRVFESAFDHMLAQVAGHLDQNVQRRVQGLLETFLKSDSVSTILLERAITLDDLPTQELEQTFNGLGLESGRLPVSFESLMQALLQGLYNALSEELKRQDSPLSPHVNSERLRQILAESRSMAKRMDILVEGQGQLHGEVKLISGKISELETCVKTPPSDLWGRVETAKELLIAFRVSAAEVILEDIKDKHWTSCPDELKPKVLAHLARSKELQGDTEEAARLHGMASDLARSSREKQVQQAYAYALRNEKQNVFALATDLIEEAPNTPDGWNLWIQTAPPEMTFDIIEAQVPETVRKDADVLGGLSARAREDGNMAKAEAYAREALATLPNSPLTHLHLALALLHKYDGQLPGAVPGQEPRRSVEEAEELLRRGLRLAGENPPRQVEVLMRANRALALRMLGRAGEALEELAALQSLGSDEPRVVLDYAQLLANQGQMNDAARVLEDYLKNHSSDMGAVLLMEVHLDQKPPNLVKALDVAEKALSETTQDPFERLWLLHHSITAAHQLGNRERAEQVLARACELPDTCRLSLHAEHRRLWGEADAAQDLMRQAVKSLGSDPDRNMRRFVAHLLERGGLHREALDVWRSLVSAEFASRDTFTFLDCAKKCESVADILDLCRRLRRNGVMLMALYDAELAALHEVNNLNEAILVTQEYLDCSLPENQKDYLRFQLSTLGIITGRRDICERSVAKLPRAMDVNAQVGEAVVKLFYAMGQPSQALDYAYTLCRRFPDRVESHRAMALGLFHEAPFGPLESESATVGSAVQYQTLKGSETGWIVLEDAADANVSRSEYGPGHRLYSAVIGKCVDDAFVLRPGQVQDVEAKIVRITSKYAYRVMESMKALSQTFGPESGLEMVCLEGKSPEDVDISPLLRDLDKHEQRAKEILRQYQGLPMPLATLSGILGKSVIVILSSLHSEMNGSIYCCTGTANEYNQALRQLRCAKAVALDLTALCTLILSDALELLSVIDAEALVTEGVLLELRDELRNSASLLRSAGSLTKIRGRYALVNMDRAQSEKWCARLTDAISLVEKTCSVVGGSVALELPPEVQSRLSHLLPHSVIETLALGQREDCVLWTDDWRLFAAAKSELHSQPRVWTQLVAQERVEKGGFPADVEARLSATMLQLEAFAESRAIRIGGAGRRVGVGRLPQGLLGNEGGMGVPGAFRQESTPEHRARLKKV